MTKVLYIETPSGYGGSMQSLLELIQRLPEGIEAHLVASYDVRKYRELPSNVRTVDLLQRPSFSHSYHGVLYRMLWWTRQTLRLIRRYRVHLVHGNNHPYAHIGSLYAARLARIPIVVSVRDFALSLKQMRIGARLYDAYIAISRAVQRNLLDLGMPAQRVHLVYNPIAPPPAVKRAPNTLPVVGMHGIVSALEGTGCLSARDQNLTRSRSTISCPDCGCSSFDNDDYPGELWQLCRDLQIDEIVQ